MKKVIGWPAVWICWHLGWLITRWHGPYPVVQWHWLIDLAYEIQMWAGLRRPWVSTSDIDAK